MASIINDRDVLLQAAGTRLLPVQLPSNYTTTGDHSGTLGGSAQTNFQNGQITFSSIGELLNAGGGSLSSLNNVGGNFLGNLSGLSQTVHRNDQITLSSTGALQNAGGGSITNLDYGNVGGTKPPPSATENFFSRSGSNPSGGSDGDAHYNTSTQTMWFKTSGIWSVGGTVNANQITVGTLAAARIASNSVTTDKLDVGGALSNITSNLGTITSGTVSTSGTIRATGTTAQAGSNYSAVFNSNGNASRGIYCWRGVVGVGSSNEGVLGQASGGGGVGGSFTGSGGAQALEAFGGILLQGNITIQTQTISNLTAGFATSAGSTSFATNATNADNADFATFASSASSATNATNAANATNSSNTSAMDGVDGSNWCRIMVTNSGSASASSSGFVLTSTVTGVRTRATGGRNVVIESFSDENLKTDIQDETLGSDFVMGLRPITYVIDGITYHGLGARHTKDHIKKIKKLRNNDSLARTLDDGTESTDGIGAIGPVIKTLQEILARLDKLEKAR